MFCCPKLCIVASPSKLDMRLRFKPKQETPVPPLQVTDKWPAPDTGPDVERIQDLMAEATGVNLRFPKTEQLLSSAVSKKKD